MSVFSFCSHVLIIQMQSSSPGKEAHLAPGRAGQPQEQTEGTSAGWGREGDPPPIISTIETTWDPRKKSRGSDWEREVEQGEMLCLGCDLKRLIFWRRGKKSGMSNPCHGKATKSHRCCRGWTYRLLNSCSRGLEFTVAGISCNFEAGTHLVKII